MLTNNDGLLLLELHRSAVANRDGDNDDCTGEGEGKTLCGLFPSEV
jgi:hypothetical protein